MSEEGVSQALAEYGRAFLERRLELPSDTRFDDRESHILRICSISSSSSSILCGLVAIYMFGAIDYKKRVFRHQLIMFLIFFDLIKLAVLLIYPSRIQTKFLAYYNHNFCEIVGFFTSVAIEGADIAILSFAIHTGLLIFRPNAKVKNGNNFEGGLFKYRFYVYLISFLTPCVLLSLAFINGSGYKPLTTWCYLPQEPKWYRLVLSWVPRYCIVITIVTIYVSIYYYVTKQYSKVGGSFRKIHNTEDEDFDSHGRSKWLKLCIKLYHNVKKVVAAILFPEMTMYPYFDEEDEDSHSKKIEMKDLDENGNVIPSGDPDNGKPQATTQDNFQEKLHKETYHQFQIRRLQIQKQMKSIFIYPISYIFLWSFPFILQCFEFNNSRSNIVWLNAVLAFFQPFNCTVDTMVFLYRERPWTLTTARTDTTLRPDYEYPIWKQKLSWLPLYGLPTAESSQKLLYDNVQKQLEKLKLRSASNSSESSPGDESKHDFSKILAGSDMDFIKSPKNAAVKSAATSPTDLKSFQFDNESPKPLTSRHGSAVDPVELATQQQYPDSKRRRSSKLSWFSAISATEGRRSSTHGSVSSSLPQPRKTSDHSIMDINEATATSPTSQIFHHAYTINNTYFDNNNNANLPEISEQRSSSSATNNLKPQQSPTSPLNVNFHENTAPPRVPSSNSVSQQLHNHPQQARNFSNAFGLTRRPSFFDITHNDSKKKNPFGDDHKVQGNNNESGTKGLDFTEGDEDDDDLDFMDFLKKGPPA